MMACCKTLFYLFVTSCLIAGCDRQPAAPTEQQQTSSTELVISKSLQHGDSFSVGEQVVVRSLAIDNTSNSLWVGTTVGVLEIDLATKQPKNIFTRKDGLANEYVFAIGIDSQGYKWFGTNAGGTTRYKDGQWKTYFPMHGLADYWIYAFAEQKNGKFWIGTWAGANSVDLASMSFTTYVKELINEWVYGIGIDSRDRIWFGTEGGISMFDGSSWQHWTHDDGLGAGNEENLPPSKNTGLGTRSRHDLNVLVDGGESYNPNYVFSVHVTPDDIVWAGTWGGGVSAYDGQKWKSFTQRDGLAGNIVYSITQDKSGALWFGTNHGLSRYDGKTWENYTEQDGLLDKDIYAIAVGSDNTVWAGTKGGVSQFRYTSGVTK